MQARLRVSYPGARLVSFNFNATESYGKEQSYNAPVSEGAAFRYANALNHLLRTGSRQRVQIGDATTVFWTAQPSAAEEVFGIIFDPQPEDETQKKELEALLRQISGGEHPNQLGDPRTPFYVLGLAANAARISIRFWHVSSVGDMVARLRQHYADLALEDEPTYFPGVQRLLDETVPRMNGKAKREDILPHLSGALMRAILEGIPYPQAFYLAILRRIRADHQVNYVRTACLKAFLRRNHGKEFSMTYDPDRPEPAYHLGAFFAILEKIQEDAHRDPVTKKVRIKDTIRDRYYGAASANPAGVFPRLIRLKQHHLGKLENIKHRIRHEKRIQAVVAKIKSYPAHLNLQDQGLFSIGYYHQRKDLFPAKAAPETQTANTEKEQ